LLNNKLYKRRLIQHTIPYTKINNNISVISLIQLSAQLT